MSRVFVDYQGQRVGTLAEARGGIFFEYDPAFIASGHQLSPLQLPLGPGLHSRDNPPSTRLPGLFEDSLPDQWGTRVMTEWFTQHGILEHTMTPFMKLAYVGRRAMGAFAYTPEEAIAAPPQSVSLADLYVAAARAENDGPINLDLLAQVGSSAGGARPKALIGIQRSDPMSIIANAAVLPDGFEAWIVKFDTSRNGVDAPMEEAYARMARAAGITIPETRLLQTTKNGKARHHFAVKRFDRNGSVRIHHHTLAAIYQVGASDLDYATFLRVTRRVTNDEREVWHAFRRAVFNVLAENRDDHGKNHGFCYQDRLWRLSPAYDLTFTGHLAERGMAVMGERGRVGASHLLKLAESASLDKTQAQTVIAEVAQTIARWPEFAESAGVPAIDTARINRVLRTLPPGVGSG
jgi:serine/threonine-protein kinase HipA